MQAIESRKAKKAGGEVLTTHEAALLDSEANTLEEITVLESARESAGPAADAAEADRAAARGSSTIRYLAVLDFEATCWADDQEKQRAELEIIEFPTVLYRIAEGGTEGRTLELVGEWRRFVRPTRNAELTTFCTELTSITQAQVDVANTIDVVLAEHHAWLLSMTAAGGSEGRVLFVTAGHWDLKTCLPLEASTKGFTSPSVYQCWTNVNEAFDKAFQSQGRKKLAQMLEIAGLTLEGHLHSGLDDSRNIGRLLEKIWERGHRSFKTWNTKGQRKTLSLL
jgi:inhibitor of KinA sporulation pathway (predicted exonuclease)